MIDGILSLYMQPHERQLLWILTSFFYIKLLWIFTCTEREWQNILDSFFSFCWWMDTCDEVKQL